MDCMYLLKYILSICTRNRCACENNTRPEKERERERESRRRIKTRRRRRRRRWWWWMFIVFVLFLFFVFSWGPKGTCLEAKWGLCVEGRWPSSPARQSWCWWWGTPTCSAASCWRAWRSVNPNRPVENLTCHRSWEQEGTCRIWQSWPQTEAETCQRGLLQCPAYWWREESV